MKLGIYKGIFISFLVLIFQINVMHAESISYNDLADKIGITIINVEYKSDRFDSYISKAEKLYSKKAYQDAKQQMDTFFSFVPFPKCDVFKLYINILKKLKLGDLQKQYNLRKTLCANEYPPKELREFTSDIKEKQEDKYLYFIKRFYYLNTDKKLYDNGLYLTDTNKLYIDLIHNLVLGEKKNPFPKSHFKTIFNTDNIDMPLLLTYYGEQYIDNTIDSEEKIKYYEKILKYEKINYEFATEYNTIYNNSYELAYQKLSEFSINDEHRLYYILKALDEAKNNPGVSNQELQNRKKYFSSKIHSYIITLLYEKDTKMKEFIPFIGKNFDEKLSKFLILLLDTESYNQKHFSRLLEIYKEMNLESLGYNTDILSQYIDLKVKKPQGYYTDLQSVIDISGLKINIEAKGIIRDINQEESISTDNTKSKKRDLDERSTTKKIIKDGEKQIDKNMYKEGVNWNQNILFLISISLFFILFLFVIYIFFFSKE